ncbi:ATP-binding protein [Pseudoalteromonas sp. OOF1S-7]|uniref:ATP-binding protein n=1 Tax=Pseudoalteromonas sp. OOF1S-7 TaxID=2917757 RepID=UPI001EF3DBC9|nr:ATP-binding protein [Pseudoalteromonas sp. OOF1S-7]MCG7535570.1 ATP-binding protein [Pseudoalteromonas sp. OOF1S-7]
MKNVLALTFAAQLCALWPSVSHSADFAAYEQQFPLKGRKTFRAALQEGEALLTQSTLTPQQRTFVLHRTALHLVRLGEYDRARNRLEALASHLSTHPDDSMQGKYHWVHGDLAFRLGHNQSAQSHFLSASQFFSRTQDWRMLSHTYRMAANAVAKGSPDLNAIEHIALAKHYAELDNNISLHNAAFDTEARIYKLFGQLDRALESRQAQLSWLGQQSEPDEAMLSSTYYGLADIFVDFGDHQAALDAFMQSYRYDEQVNDHLYMGQNQIRIAEQFLQLGNLIAANKAYEQAKVLSESIAHKRNLGWAIAGLGRVEFAKKNYPQAANLIGQGLALINPVHSQALHSQHLVWYASALSHQNPAQAIEQLASFFEVTPTDTMVEAAKVLAFAHLQQQDFAAALRYQTHATELLQQQTEQSRLTRLEAKKRDAELHLETLKVNQLQSGLDEQKRQNKLQSVILAAAIIVLLNFFLMFYLYHLKKRKVMEKEAAVLNQALTLKQQLLADVSHELRTPLTVLKLNIEALQHNLITDPDATYTLMQSRLSMLNTLIADIYELAQADTHSLQLDLQIRPAKALFDELLSAIKPLIAQHELKLNTQNTLSDTLEIACDIDRMHQIFNNLARNSCHYTNKPGQISVTITQQAEHLICHFEDSSPGVGDADLPRLTERLYRCDKSRSRDLGGSGLGLSICQKLTELHQGQLSLSHSKLGGLCVTLTLPLVQPAQSDN